MLSRVANSIYWMTRYLERTENVARFLDVNLHMMLDLKIEENQQWEPLVITTGDNELFYETYDKANKENVAEFLTFDKNNPNSIISSLKLARENARSIREIISSEMWEQVNKFYYKVLDAERNGVPSDSIYEFYNMIKNENHLFIGITDSTMQHDEGWQFAQLGRHIERADKTSRILDVKYFILLEKPDDVGTPLDNIQWAALLTSASALEMYRKKFQLISPHKIAQFLILDRDFPRAVRYCIINVEQSLHSITGSVLGTFQNEAERKIGKLRAQLDFADIDEIIDSGLHEYLVDNFQVQLNDVGKAINDTFFDI
ncbi:MAG: alpha-E domain-containing protein [Thermodesulfobacteriota bacterium]